MNVLSIKKVSFFASHSDAFSQFFLLVNIYKELGSKIHASRESFRSAFTFLKELFFIRAKYPPLTERPSVTANNVISL